MNRSRKPRALATLRLASFFALAAIPLLAQSEIVVPASSVARSIDRGIRCHSNYLIWKGPAFAHSSSWAPLAWDDNNMTHGPAVQGTTIQGYYPIDLYHAYKMPPYGGTGTIAIVDAFSCPAATGLTTAGTSMSDFNTFAKQFNLPTETSTDPTADTNKVFQVKWAAGVEPPTDAGWAGEEALDIEWAHALAPQAKIVLVEAASNADNDLFNAVTYAASLPGVIEVSMSFGGGEFPAEVQFDSTFVAPNIVFFASSGDFGGAQEYPSESPNVVGVGGTHLEVTPQGNVTSETAWDGSGGGPSSVEPRPAYQSPIVGIVGSVRGCPDVSADADPFTGVAVYGQTAFMGWQVIGGTSLACPITAAMTNMRGYYTSGSTRELSRIYFNLGGPYWRDITGGTAGSFFARNGWDYITGIGVPVGLFPVPVPPSVVKPDQAIKYTGASSTGTLGAIYSTDNVTYNIASTLTSIGQVAALKTGFIVDRDPSVLSGMQISTYSKAPLGCSQQIFLYNWSTHVYDYIQANPCTGNFATTKFNLNAKYVAPNTRAVVLLYRAVRPLHLNAGPFTYLTDKVQLAELTSPPFDPGGP